MIQEILDFYFESRISSKKEEFVTKDHLKQHLNRKLDKSFFEDHVKRTLLAENTASDNFVMHEKLFNLERSASTFVTRDDL